MTPTLRKTKNWKGRDGIGYQAELVLDGTPVAFFSNDGAGGCTRWDVYKPETLKAYAQQVGVENAAEIDWSMPFIDSAMDTHVAGLMDDVENEKQLRRWCRKDVIFTVPGEPDGKFRSVKKARPTQKLRAQILKQYPGATIINDRFPEECAYVGCKALAVAQTRATIGPGPQITPVCQHHKDHLLKAWANPPAALAGRPTYVVMEDLNA
jgi:hypothetical protein